MRLEVKQSAALQTWMAQGKCSTPSFGIAAKTGYSSNGADWRQAPGRHADIYVFALHPETGSETADHRRSDQC